jgi:hypothetical protein
VLGRRQRVEEAWQRGQVGAKVAVPDHSGAGTVKLRNQLRKYMRKKKISMKINEKLDSRWIERNSIQAYTALRVVTQEKNVLKSKKNQTLEANANKKDQIFSRKYLEILSSHSSKLN